MAKKTYIVTIEIGVHDPIALYDAAASAVRGDGYPDPAALLGTREEPGVGACLQYVFDPGASPPGTEILESQVEAL